MAKHCKKGAAMAFYFRRSKWFAFIFSWTCLAGCLPFVANAQTDCNNLPPPNPGKSFFANFSNHCYAIQLTSGHGNTMGRDLNAKYATVYYRVDPRYELILFGTFPHSRYMSLAVYDDHEATLGVLIDGQLVPLTATTINPFQPHMPFQDYQYYAAAVSLGGTLPPPGNVTPGCDVDTMNVHANQLDASLLHKTTGTYPNTFPPGMTWTGDPRVPDGFPPHETGANQAGAMMFRSYLDQPVSSPLSIPVVFVRDLTTGCAVPAAQAVQQGTITTDRNVYESSMVHSQQVNAHYNYADSILPKTCYTLNPADAFVWLRGPYYVSGTSPDTAYMGARLPSLKPAPGDVFMRLRFQLPVMPKIPCSNGCSLTGSEQLRYWSLSVESTTTPKQTMIGAGTTLASLSDLDMVTDENGFVTLIVGLGTAPPSWVTRQNGFTYFDLSQIANWQTATFFQVRNIVPSAGFSCAANAIDYLTSESNSLGGFMGNYGLFVDYLSSAEIPKTPGPYPRNNSCGLAPPETPGVCSSLTAQPLP